MAGKFPLLPYHNPASITLKSIRSGRRRIRAESTLLQKFKGTIWPQREVLLRDLNPFLPPAWGIEVCNKELYLLMEWIDGVSLSFMCREKLNLSEPNLIKIEQLISEVALSLIPFLLNLYRQGYLYIDIKPEHILITKNLSNPVRLLDAGGTYRIESPISHVPVTQCYLLPDVHHLWKNGKTITPDETWVIHALGKTFLASMSNREMLAGYSYNAAEMLPFYSKSIQEYIEGLLQVRWQNLEDVWEVTQSIFLKEGKCLHTHQQ